MKTAMRKANQTAQVNGLIRVNIDLKDLGVAAAKVIRAWSIGGVSDKT